MLTKKQKLILFLISSEPGIKSIYSLNKLFDKVNFPAKISENLYDLIQDNLIIATENFENGTAKEYQITEKGRMILINESIDSEIIDYVKEMDEPKLILEIIDIYINKKNGS